MTRKRICVIIAQAEENTQNHFLQGFLEEAFKKNYDVCVFSMYLKYQDSTYREVGDSNIYNLIDFDLFDAVVICQDTLQTNGLVEKLEKRIKDEFAGGVVVVIDKENDNFPTIMMDHYTPIVKLVDHLVDDHGYKNIYFLNGKKGHIHSTERLAGYVDSMTAHGLPVTDDMIYYGTYWYDSGDYMVDELVNKGTELPEAIVCANDCMAIGVCAAFERHGIRVPDDIAIVGYDSIEDGRMSPVPITSADIPAAECGRYCLGYVDAKLRGMNVPKFETNVDLFMGGTCGCTDWKHNIKEDRREHWDTDMSSNGFYSCFNNMMDDLSSQTDAESFYNTVFQYVYQIRPFNEFHLCLNENWKDPELMLGEDAIRYGYSDRMYRIIKCGPKGEEDSVISYDDVFDSKILLPELYQYREYPTAYIFTPIFFQDRSFGYAVINYGQEPRVYEDVYRVWMKNVARGVEAYSRYAGMNSLIEKMQAGQIRDALTGEYNYRGFMGKATELIEEANRNEKEILITAIDVKNVNKINNTYGRSEGDKLIQYVSRLLNECLISGEVAMRMANDEFVIASVVNVGDAGRSDYIVAKLESAFEEINKNRDICCDVGIYYAHASGLITTNDAMEHLVNDAINQKNQIKARLSGKGHSEKVVTEEDLKRDAIVKHILDENLFMYYFQPIVSARDGSIFAYEALMRADVPERISPLDILESAERLGRLYDVEKHTMFNVLRCIEKNPEMFEDKKVFINSIPGYVLEAEDRDMFVKRLKGLTCKGIVIELTERDELGDSEIEGLKTFMETHNLEFAIDDYGSGYSNVNNLLRYMPDYVKIDRMLLTGIDNDAHRQHFVKDIIEFTQDNDIMALAEGVETTKEMKTVIQLGTNLIQGYYTAKPKPEIIQQVQPNITNEIVQYNQSDMITDNNKVFVMEHDSSVSLMTMATENYREIVLRQSATKDGPVHIIGAPGFMSDITLTIEEKFVGTVILQNASFAGEKMMPCIECGAGADVTLVLEGNNTLRTGGIKVPENAKLTVKGEGNLKIDLNNSRYYGIGNDLKSKHGVLNFEQDGTININAKGMTGVAIGSGYGQNIRITRGRFDLHIFGQNGVAIGSVYAPADVVISDTDMDINYEVSHGAVIGSYKQGANVDISTSSINVKCAGNKYSAFGSLEGDFCQVRIDSAHVEVNARGRESKVIGSQEGPVNTQISDSSIRMTIQGSECMAVGNPDRKGHFKNSNSDLAVTVKNNSGVDIALKDSDIELINGRYMFMVNNENIERKVREIF